MLMIALAAEIMAPAPSSIDSWLSYNDVPEYLLRRGPGLWSVPVRLTIEPTGQIASCEAEAAGPIPELNAHTCRIIQRRAKLKPAMVAGVPTYGVYRTSVRYVVANTPWDTSKVSSPDIDVVVNRLPAGVASPNLVRVAFVVGVNGEKSSCEADEASSFEIVNNHPALISLACDQVRNEYEATPAKTSAGPVTSVQNASVRFLAPKVPGK